MKRLSFLALLFVSCLSSCMKDLSDTPVYEGGFSVEYKRGLFGGNFGVHNKSNAGLRFKTLKINPETRELVAEEVEIDSDAGTAMKAFEGNQLNFNAGQLNQLEQSRIQQQTTQMVLQEVRGAFNEGMAAATGMMQLRNERATIRNAAPPGLLEQNMPAIIQLLAEIAGGPASDQQLRAKETMKAMGFGDGQ